MIVIGMLFCISLPNCIEIGVVFLQKIQQTQFRRHEHERLVYYEGVCVPFRLMNCLFPVPDSQPTATELFQSPLYGSGTVFRSISHLLRHFPSSALV